MLKDHIWIVLIAFIVTAILWTITKGAWLEQAGLMLAGGVLTLAKQGKGRKDEEDTSGKEVSIPLSANNGGNGDKD